MPHRPLTNMYTRRYMNMYVFVYVYMYIYIYTVFLFSFIYYIKFIYIYIYIYIYIFKYLNKYIYIYIYMWYIFHRVVWHSRFDDPRPHLQDNRDGTFSIFFGWGDWSSRVCTTRSCEHIAMWCWEGCAAWLCDTFTVPSGNLT